jgi:3-isopropylmalate/(R)-2-methylmalate dehydratase large subunit
MNIAEKILAHAADLDTVSPGQFVTCRLSLVLANDITAPIALQEFHSMGAERVFDPERIALVADHNTPNKDIASAQNTKLLRDFAAAQGMPHFYEATDSGIEHIILPDKGLVLPGDVIIGADSHTCTYGALGAFATGVGSTDAAAGMALGESWFRVPETMKFVFHGELQPWVSGKDLILYTIGQIGVDGARYRAMEFAGPVIENLEMAGRFTMANMAIEAGGKAGLIAPDQTTLDWVGPRAQRDFTVFTSDPDADYAEVYEWDASTLEPQVAFPHLPENTKGISEVGEVTIDQAVIGACASPPRFSRGASSPPVSAVSSSPGAPKSISKPPAKASSKPSSPPAVWSVSPPAVPASVDTWAVSPLASAPSLPLTATSSGVWAIPRAKSISPVPPSLPPLP